MNGLITTSRIEKVVSIPVSLPQAELRRGDSIVLSTIPLALGQRLSIDWLSFKLLSAVTTTPARINTSLGIVYLGVYAGQFDKIQQPNGTPIYAISCSGPSTKLLNPYIRRVFVGPDVISVIAVNNTSNADVATTCTGSLRLYIDG